jgi:predicted deacylase
MYNRAQLETIAMPNKCLIIPAIVIITLMLADSALPAQTPASITVGTAVATPGKLAYGQLAVPAGNDAGTTIEVAVINGAKPGKVVAFVSGAHGTEYASVVALTRLITRLDPSTLSGTVIIVPLLNVASFEQMTPHVNPIDKKGMNAGYPGGATGTQTERALALVAAQVVKPADVVVDLHGGDLDEDLRPYSYWTRTGNTKQDEESRTLALAFGLDHIIVRDVDLTNPASTRSLSGFTMAQGKTALVAEAGRSGLVLEPDVNALINGCLNLLGSMKMIARPVTAAAKTAWVGAPSTITADKAGMFFATAKRDTIVEKDAPIGYTTDYVGRRTAEIRSSVSGLITYIRGVPSMPAGGTIVSISPVLTTIPPYKKP